MKTSIAAVVLGVLSASATAEARFYSGQTARFLQSDRAGMIDGPNTYAYAASNPVTNEDPTGFTVEPLDFRSRVVLVELMFSPIGNAVVSSLQNPDVYVGVQLAAIPQGEDGYTFGTTSPAQGSRAQAAMCPSGSIKQLVVSLHGRFFFEQHAGSLGMQQSDTLIHELVHADQWIRGLPRIGRGPEREARSVEYVYRSERGATLDQQVIWAMANSPYFEADGFSRTVHSIANDVLGRMGATSSLDPGIYRGGW